MRSAFCLAPLLLASPALAQSADVQLGPNGFSMRVDGATTVQSTEEAYRFAAEPSSDRSTVLRIVEPEGVACEVFDGKKLVASDDVPLSFEAAPEKFYRFVVKLPSGTFEKKVSVKKGQLGTLWVRGAAKSAPPPPFAPREQVEDHPADGYRLVLAPHPEGKTVFRVVSPEGAHAAIFDGPKQVAAEDGPLSFDAAPDRYYRVVLVAADGAKWERKLQARSRMVTSLAVTPPPPPPPAAAPAPQAMSDADLKQLVAAIEHEAFPEQKVDVLSTAAKGAFFTVEQVGRLVDLYAFPDNKVQAVELTRAHIVDPQNAFKLYGHFAFPDDKERVKQLFERR